MARVVKAIGGRLVPGRNVSILSECRIASIDRQPGRRELGKSAGDAGKKHDVDAPRPRRQADEPASDGGT